LKEEERKLPDILSANSLQSDSKSAPKSKPQPEGWGLLRVG
jgi:hypothetical protein